MLMFARHFILGFIFWIGLAFTNAAALAQCESTWLPFPSNHAPHGPNGTIYTMAVVFGGDVIVGGRFSRVGDQGANSIARYSPGTNTWSPLGSGVIGESFGEVRAILAISGGDIIVGGSFTHAGGVEVNNLARYSPATNTWSAVGGGTNGRVSSLCLAPDGRLIVGGDFSRVGGDPFVLGPLVRYSLSTQQWTSLPAGFINGTNVVASAVMANGDLVVGFDLTTAHGFRRLHFGTNYSTYDTFLPQAPNTGIALLALSNGDLLIGARDLPTGGGCSRYSPSGNFFEPLGSGTNGYVTAFSRYVNGDILVAGDFTIAGGQNVSRFGRYNPATFTWSQLGTAQSASVPTTVVVTNSDDVLAGGGPSRFSVGGMNSDGYFGRFNTFYNQWINPVGLNGPARAVLHLPSGDVIVGGAFTFAGGLPSQNIARFSPATESWSPLGAGCNDVVNGLSLHPNGEVIVVGKFTEAGGIASSRSARYNPITNSWLSLPGSPGSEPTSVAVLPNGDIFAGGKGQPTGRATRFSFATNIWTSLGSVGRTGQTFGHVVNAVTTHPNGSVYFAGKFDIAGGVTVNNIARWNPATSTWSGLGGGPDEDVYALAVAANGDLFLGGNFFVPGAGQFAARWIPSTSTWAPAGSGLNSPVYAFTPMSNGDMIAGGQFTTAGSGDASRVARFSYSTMNWSPLPGGLPAPFGNEVLALSSNSAGDICAGGTFADVNSRLYNFVQPVAANNFARWSETSPPVLLSQPVSVSACPSTLVTFNAPATGTMLGYQWRWRELPAGINWYTVVNGTNRASITNAAWFTASGANAPTLAVINFPNADPSFAFTPREFRLTVTSSCGFIYSDIVSLNVCRSDINCDSSVDFFDYLDFVDAFSVGSPVADFNRDSVIDFFDYLDYVDVFSTGC